MTTTGTAHGCPVNESFDPLSPDFLADPYAAMAALPRKSSPSSSPRRSAITS